MRGRRTLYLLVALFLTLWLCVIFAAGTIVFAAHTDGALYRYPGCYAFGTPIWRYRDATDFYTIDRYTHMPQSGRATFDTICYPPAT